MRTNCPNCGKTVYHNEGVSAKTGKPYENYKCPDKNCGFIEWVDLAPKKVLSPGSGVDSPRGGAPNWDELRDEKNKNINHLNARTAACEFVRDIFKAEGSPPSKSIADKLIIEWTDLIEQI